MDLSMMRNVLAIAEGFIMYAKRSLARSSVKHLLTDREKNLLVLLILICREQYEQGEQTF